MQAAPQMADLLSRHYEPELLLDALAPNLRAAVSFDFLNFAVHDPAGPSMKLHLWNGEGWPNVLGEIPIKEAAAGWVWENQEPLTIDDLELETRFERGLEWMREHQMRSYSLAPLSTSHIKLGALGIGSKSPHAYNPHDVEYLLGFAGIVARCLDRTLVRPTLDEEKSRLELLLADVEALTARNFQTISPPSRRRGHPDGPGESSLFLASPEGLEDPEQLLAAYFGSSTVGLCVVDRQLRFLAINNALAAMNGMPASAHLGKTVREVLGDAAQEFEPEFEKVLATGEPVLDREMAAKLPTRNEVGHWLEHFFPIKGADDKVERIGVVVVEISRQKKLEESLRAATDTLRKEKERLQVLLGISRVLAANWDVRQVFPRISAVLRRALQHECAFFGLYDQENKVFVRQAMDFPLSKGLFSAQSAISAGGPQGQAVAERRAIALSRDDIAAFQADPSMANIAQSLLEEGIKSLCCVPLVRPGGAVGALSLASTRADAFHPEDLGLLNQVGAQLAIALENARAARRIQELEERLSQERHYLEDEIHSEANFEEIIGSSPALKKVLEQVFTVADSDATVLILGETGTGKELIAHAIHRLSRRRDKNFVKVNCAAIPTGLLESELFGHERGAFTGAVSQKVGRMELANSGTLFLDEVGDIPLELQPKLLRVLQDQEFERLGATRTIKVNLRLIAATNRDLATSVAAGEFRSDLYYRLNVFPVRMPALRERREDIPMLVRYFVRQFAHRMERQIETIPSEAMKALTKWHWPGNVRELENFIERSVILSEGRALRVPVTELSGAGMQETPVHTLERAEREHIIRLLRETGGVISGPAGAAHRLGLKRTTLQSKIRKLGIRRDEYIDLKKA